MKTILGVLSIVVALAAAAAAHGATTVNFDAGSAAAALYTDVGAAPDAGTTWTQTFAGGTTPNLVDSFGFPTGVDLTINTGWGGATTQGSYGVTYFNNLTRDRFYTIGAGASPQFGFAGLDAAKTYNVYLYSTKHSTNFELVSTGADRAALGWTQAYGPADFHEADTYAAFRGLTGSTSQMFTLNGLPPEGWGGGTYGALSGMQIQEVSKPGALKQYWAFDDGATDPASRTAANAIETGNTGLTATYTSDKTPPPGNWVTSGLETKLASRVTAPSTSAIDLDPSNAYDYVDAGHVGHSTSGGGGGEATLSMWINPDALSSDMRLLGHLNPNGYAGPLQGAVRVANGQLQVWNASAWENLSGAGEIVAGQWQHVALTWQGDQMAAHVDGVQTGTATSGFYYNGAPTAIEMGIGAKYLGLYGTSFDGQIDDVALWTQSLKSDTIGFLADGASPLNPVAQRQYLEVVNVDVQGGNHPTYDGLGAANDELQNTHWNRLAASDGYDVSDLLASDGTTATMIDVKIENFQGATDAYAHISGNTLQGDRVYDSGAPGQGVVDFTIDGLDPGFAYDIYFYTSEHPTEFTLNGLTLATVPGGAGSMPIWREGFDYVLFENLWGTTTLSGTLQVPFGGTGYSALSGIQIARHYVPEPASVVLWTVLVAGAIGLRRRRGRTSGPNR